MEPRIRQVRRKLARLSRFLLLVLLVSCNGNTLLYQYCYVGEDGWDRQDTLVFPIDSIDTDVDCEMYVGLRLHPRYPYQQLYIIAEQRFQTPDSLLHSRKDGGSGHRDTLCIAIADSTGRLKGSGLSLLQYEQHAFPLHLRKNQRGEILLYHAMQRERLPWIHDVGIRIFTHP